MTATTQFRPTTIKDSAQQTVFSTESNGRKFLRGTGRVLKFAAGATIVCAGFYGAYALTAAIWALVTSLMATGGIIPILFAIMIMGTIPFAIIIPSMFCLGFGGAMVEHSINN